jgi:hypothetical protein
MISIVEGALIRSYGNPISDAGMIGRDYSSGCFQKFQTFQSVSLTEICVEIHKGSEIDTWSGYLFRNIFEGRPT